MLTALLLAASLATATPAQPSMTFEEFQEVIERPVDEVDAILLNHMDVAYTYAKRIWPKMDFTDCVHGGCRNFLPPILGRQPSYREFGDCEFGGGCDGAIAAYWLYQWNNGMDTTGWGYPDWLLAYYRVMVYQGSVKRSMTARDQVIAGQKPVPPQYEAWCNTRPGCVQPPPPTTTPDNPPVDPPKDPPVTPTCPDCPVCPPVVECPPQVICEPCVAIPPCPPVPATLDVPKYVRNIVNTAPGWSFIGKHRREQLLKVAKWLESVYGYVPGEASTGVLKLNLVPSTEEE